MLERLPTLTCIRIRDLGGFPERTGDKRHHIEAFKASHSVFERGCTLLHSAAPLFERVVATASLPCGPPPREMASRISHRSINVAVCAIAGKARPGKVMPRGSRIPKIEVD